MASSRASRAQRKPMPVGPQSLWEEPTRKSAPSWATSRGRWARLWQASTSNSAPAAWARGAISAIGFRQPRVLLTCTRLTRRVRPLSWAWKSARSSSPRSVRPTWRRTQPVRAASSCQGTRLLWCSMTLSSTSSPALRLASPQLRATRLIASLALRVNTISWGEAAPTKAAVLARAPSKPSVARALSWWAPRCTLALSWS